MKLRLSPRPTEPRALAVRSPVAATISPRWTAKNQPMIPEWNAEQAVRWGQLSNWVLYRASRLIAESLAGCPFRAGADPDQPTRFNPRSRLAQLLGPPPGGPAPKISARMLWGHAVVQYLVTGRFGWEIESTPGGQVAALWPLVARLLEAIPTPNGERSTEFFQGFKYGIGGKESRKDLRADQVFYVWRPGQNDWREPESAIQAARLDVSTAVMQGRYDYAFLQNGAVPATVVTHLAMENQEARDTFRAQFNADHHGPDNAGRTYFMEADPNEETGELLKSIDIQVLGLSHGDMQAFERLKEYLRNIAAVLGVPWSLLDASGRTYDNASAEWVTFWTITMKPLMADLQDHVNMELAPRVGSDVGWFDLSQVEALKPKRKFIPIQPDRAVAAGLAAIDEWREDIGLAPLPDGAGQWKKPEPKPVPVAPPVTEESSTNVPDLQLAASAPPVQIRAIDPAVRRSQKAVSFEGQARALEKMFERAMKKLFERQRVAVLKRLEGKRGYQALRATDAQVPDASVVFSEVFWLTETEDIAHGLYEAVFAAGAARLAGELDVGLPKREALQDPIIDRAFDVESAYAQDFIDARANQLADNVTETTYKAIKTAMAEGVGQGESIPQLAERMRAIFKAADELRSRTIARTEVISGYNGSVNLVAGQLGPEIVGGKEWLSAHDSRTRADHAAADGQVVGLAEGFDVGGENLEYPGDPNGSAGNVINCRCTQILLTPEEMAERSKRRVSVRTVERLAARVKLRRMTLDEAIAELKEAPQLELVG